jgi:hypothetical protein
MRLFLSELSYLSEVYNRLETELGGQALTPSERDPDAWVESLLANGELLDRVSQLDERVAQLAVEWVRYRDHLAPDTIQEVLALAERLRGQAARLSAICGERVELLRTTLARLERYLGQVRAGNRLLASLKTMRTLEPRFVDSEG